MKYVTVARKFKRSDAQSIRDYLRDSEGLIAQNVPNTNMRMWLELLASEIDEEFRRADRLQVMEGNLNV